MNGRNSVANPVVGKTTSSGVVAAVVVVLVLVLIGIVAGVLYLSTKSAFFRELVIAIALVVAVYRTLTRPGRETKTEIQELRRELRNGSPQ